MSYNETCHPKKGGEHLDTIKTTKRATMDSTKTSAKPTARKSEVV